MEYVTAWLVLVAVWLVALRWWRRKQAWRRASDVEAEEAVAYFRRVKAMPETPQELLDLNRARARYELPRDRGFFEGFHIVEDRNVPLGRAYLFAGESVMLMRPEHVAVITGLS